MDFANFAILYILIVVQVGGYFWLQKASRREGRFKHIYQYVFDSYMVVGLLVMAVFELLAMAFH